MRNKLWYEIAQARFGFEYLALFLDVQKWRKKWFKILVLIFSTGGIMGWKIWEYEYATQIACGVIAVVELFQLLENQIILKDEKLEKLSDLRIKYLEYSNHLEKLWLEFETETRDETTTRDIYFKLRNKEYVEIQKMDNELDIPQIEKTKKKAESIASNYLRKHFIN